MRGTGTGRWSLRWEKHLALTRTLKHPLANMYVSSEHPRINVKMKTPAHSGKAPDCTGLKWCSMLSTFSLTLPSTCSYAALNSSSWIGSPARYGSFEAPTIARPTKRRTRLRWMGRKEEGEEVGYRRQSWSRVQGWRVRTTVTNQARSLAISGHI